MVFIVSKHLSGYRIVCFLGVDIGASSIKVVQLSRKHDRAILETYAKKDIGPDSDLANIEPPILSDLEQASKILAKNKHPSIFGDFYKEPLATCG